MRRRGLSRYFCITRSQARSSGTAHLQQRARTRPREQIPTGSARQRLQPFRHSSKAVRIERHSDSQRTLARWEGVKLLYMLLQIQIRGRSRKNSTKRTLSLSTQVKKEGTAETTPFALISLPVEYCAHSQAIGSPSPIYPERFAAALARRVGAEGQHQFG